MPVEQAVPVRGGHLPGHVPVHPEQRHEQAQAVRNVQRRGGPTAHDPDCCLMERCEHELDGKR